jgi:hypothetical protein
MLIESVGAPQKEYWRIQKTAKPEFSTADTIREKPVEVALTVKTEGAEIRYTLDGSLPGRTSKIYTKPLLIKESTIVKARAFHKDFVPGAIAQRSYYIVKKRVHSNADNNLKQGIRYYYYEGDWEKVPDFELAIEKSNGVTSKLNLDIDRRASNFAIDFTGFLKIDKSGIYKFYLISNDGSRLSINNILVVDNDGTHGSEERAGKIKLPAGLYPLELKYFDGGGSQALNLTYEGPGIKRQEIPVEKLMYGN